MKISRRSLGGIAAGVLSQQAAQRAPGQTPQEGGKTDFAKAARESGQRNSETLAKFVVPIATEPAFQFKP